MKNIVSSAIIAFSMYSTLPMPRVDWEEGNMPYSMCFFPLIGLVSAVALLLWGGLCAAFSIGPTLFAAVATLLPLGITGGIHLDGFCDTVDALSSHQGREKRLEILKDPHIGAFGVMGCVALLLLTFALFTEVPAPLLPLVGWGYCLSRLLSGLGVVSFPLAKTSGLAATFSGRAERSGVRTVLFLALLGLGGYLLWRYQILGALTLAAALVCFALYHRLAVGGFGGITGDLAGYFLQICELAVLVTAVVGGRMYL